MKQVHISLRCFVFLLLSAALAVLSFASALDDPDLDLDTGDAFSVVWFSDTQSFVERENLAEHIPEWFDWIGHMRDRLNIAAVVHTGDIVENGWNPVYWDRINSGINRIPADIPFIAAAGNHDVAKREFTYENWVSQPFVKNYPPENVYKNGEGVYSAIERGGHKMLFVALGYNSIDADGTSWMRAVFDAHPDYTGVIVAHSVLSYNQQGRSSTYTPAGKFLMDEVAAKCPNVKLVLCGHIAGMDVHKEVFHSPSDSEHSVYVMRYNYQDCYQLNRMGYFRILKFYPATDSLEVVTYSPVVDSFHYKGDNPRKEHFILTDIFYKG